MLLLLFVVHKLKIYKCIIVQKLSLNFFLKNDQKMYKE